MKQQNSPRKQDATEMIVHGMVVRLLFAEQPNTDLPKLVLDLLKSSHIQKIAGRGDAL